MKEWTFLVYLNGHNNLDHFGAININQMEQVGSTKDVNIVVQWASNQGGSTKRLLVKKDNDPKKVTSPVVQDMGKVDMGDWRNIVEFVKWAQTNYPAKHYFLNIWDHGSGWHAMQLQDLATNSPGRAFFPMDISWDDDSGNSITTEQLGQALAESAQVIGHKIDVYGSDACLMAMAEVAGEMADSVEYFVGSEEVEPAAGWPYDALLKRWTANPTASGADIAKILTTEYVKSYTNGSNGNQDVTFSAFNLAKMGSFNESITALGSKLQHLDVGGRKKVVSAINETQYFTDSDYGDLGDFLTLVERNRTIDADVIGQVRNNIDEFVIANQTSPRYSKAKGVAIWLPGSKDLYQSYSNRYQKMHFNLKTNWGQALQSILQETN